MLRSLLTMLLLVSACAPSMSGGSGSMRNVDPRDLNVRYTPAQANRINRTLYIHVTGEQAANLIVDVRKVLYQQSVGSVRVKSPLSFIANELQKGLSPIFTKVEVVAELPAKLPPDALVGELKLTKLLVAIEPSDGGGGEEYTAIRSSLQSDSGGKSEAAMSDSMSSKRTWSQDMKPMATAQIVGELGFYQERGTQYASRTFSLDAESPPAPDDLSLLLPMFKLMFERSLNRVVSGVASLASEL
ncbi:MAG: hypothetical protein IT381_19040 [Deltaproteobacteria bacterium]|nr:hypothetical protein [Deltaproteobacteria bacterium]